MQSEFILNHVFVQLLLKLLEKLRLCELRQVNVLELVETLLVDLV